MEAMTMAEYMKKSDVIAYIRNEAKEAQSAFEELGGESGIIAEAFEDLANELEDFPAADVAPVRHGRWLSHYRSGTTVSEGVVSSCCDMWNNRKSYFCPNCGARMDGAE
jgi:hypothetical protein